MEKNQAVLVYLIDFSCAFTIEFLFSNAKLDFKSYLKVNIVSFYVTVEQKLLSFHLWIANESEYDLYILRIENNQLQTETK